MKGWFDAFRIDGGPTLYSYSNRTPVTGDVPLVIVFVVFGTIFTAFLVIFPGIRKEVNVFPSFSLLLLSCVIDRYNYELITIFFLYRSQRFSTFLTVTLSLFVGASIQGLFDRV